MATTSDARRDALQAADDAGGPDLDVQPDLDRLDIGPEPDAQLRAPAAEADGEAAGSEGAAGLEDGLAPGAAAAPEPEAGDLEERQLDALLDAEQGVAPDPGAPSLLGSWAEAPPSGLLGEEGELGVDEGDEVDTRLDLARAYLDLGDEAGARELLQAVQEAGVEAQRERARHILGELGGE